MIIKAFTAVANNGHRVFVHGDVCELYKPHAGIWIHEMPLDKFTTLEVATKIGEFGKFEDNEIRELEVFLRHVHPNKRETPS